MDPKEAARRLAEKGAERAAIEKRRALDLQAAREAGTPRADAVAAADLARAEHERGIRWLRWHADAAYPSVPTVSGKPAVLIRVKAQRRENLPPFSPFDTVMLHFRPRGEAIVYWMTLANGERGPLLSHSPTVDADYTPTLSAFYEVSVSPIGKAPAPPDFEVPEL